MKVKQKTHFDERERNFLSDGYPRTQQRDHHYSKYPKTLFLISNKIIQENKCNQDIHFLERPIRFPNQKTRQGHENDNNLSITQNRGKTHKTLNQR